ncbi:hypothetical protein RUM44_011609 [Polyplax serrata]|uniref:Lamin n=1 Tax=Polyplax serrata TaxID=468196 RepID=A0ABR1AQU1_POLSC
MTVPKILRFSLVFLYMQFRFTKSSEEHYYERQDHDTVGVAVNEEVFLDKKTKECRGLEASLNICEHRTTDLQSKYNQAIMEKKKLDDELKEALKELDKLRKANDMTKKYIENETLARVELENKIQSMNEEMNFKNQMYQKEIGELRMKRSEEISELDGRLTIEYEDKLQAALQDLREQHEMQQMANRDEIMALYESKIKNLQDHYVASAAQASSQELTDALSRIDSLNGQLSKLESANAGFCIRIKELEKLLDVERSRKLEQLALMEQELAKLRMEMAEQLKDYHDLMDIKVALDTEISAYRKLLEFEESRLNITPAHINTAASGGGSSSSSIQVTRRGTPIRRTPLGKGLAANKRRRILVDESQEADSFQVSGEAKGDIEISDVDHREGKFIQLHNKSDKELSLSGWSIKHSAGTDDTETTFKFHRSVKIDGKGHVTVWSMDSGRTHNPPEHIVMKQKWFMGDSVMTILVNNDGEEVASRSRQRIQYFTTSGYSTSYRREREGSEETQDGDPKRDSCRMM